ncbi:MAG: hypothetical protein HKO10_07870, partial [Acidimicrobiia bacterium]|nr:hypothetical protein [Acidimicrobiia bacterium]
MIAGTPQLMRRLVGCTAAVLVAALLVPVTSSTPAAAGIDDTFVVLLQGNQTDAGFEAAANAEAGLVAITSLGGLVTSDLSNQIGGLVVKAGLVDASGLVGLVEEAGLVGLVDEAGLVTQAGLVGDTG